MFWSFLFYSTLSAEATENDGAIIIRLGGEVISADAKQTTTTVAAPISLDVVHMDINEIIRIFSSHSGQNILLAEGIQGTVSARITNQPWDIALLSIVESNGWTLTSIGEILLVKPIQTATK